MTEQSNCGIFQHADFMMTFISQCVYTSFDCHWNFPCSLVSFTSFGLDLLLYMYMYICGFRNISILMFCFKVLVLKHSNEKSISSIPLGTRSHTSFC